MARRARPVPGRWIPVPGRWISAALVGGVWWWAVCRLALWPESAGPVEGAVAAAGWGLSLLPVHCGPRAGRREGALDEAVRGGAVGEFAAPLVGAWRWAGRWWRRRSQGG